MVGDASRHCGRDAESLVDSAEIVVHEVQGDHMIVILQFLAESVGVKRRLDIRIMTSVSDFNLPQ